MEFKEKLISVSSEESKEDINDVKKQVNYKDSNIFSFLFFGWSIIALTKSNKRLLKINDINNLEKTQTTKYNLNNLKKLWEYYSNMPNKRNSLMKTIFYSHYKSILILFFLDIIKMFLEYIRVFFFRQIIYNFSKGNFQFYNDLNTFITKTKNLDFDIFFSSILFIVTKIFNTLLFNHLEFRNILLREQITNEITGLIYEKILQSNISSNGKDEGEILSLIEVDCEKIGFLFFIGPRIVTAPIRIFISMDLLFRLFGFNFIYGILVIIFCIIIIMLLQIIYLRNLEQLLIKKDERSKLVTHILHILKNIKINGLEEEFHEKVKGKRNEELLYLKKNLNIGLIRMLINSNMPLILLIVSLGSYIYKYHQIEISNLFSANQLIKSLTEPLMAIPLFLNEFFSNLLSIDRIQKYLYTVDHDYTKHENLEELEKNNILVQFENCSFGLKTNLVYSKDEHDFRKTSIFTTIGENKEIVLLKNINLKVLKGEFVAILGPTGSGKTCLVNAILNNYSLISCDSNPIINGVISYTPQVNWVMNDTIKNNVLFYQEYDEEKYNNIIKVSQLSFDLQNFEDGDLTVINTNGNNISGGQRARISLARSLYRDADLYLLDDPLANIDAKVGNKIYKEALTEYLKDKTRILITNEFTHLVNCDKIIYINQGKIEFTGNYKDFISKYGANFLSKEENKTKIKADAPILHEESESEDEIDYNQSSTTFNKVTENPLELMNKSKLKLGKVSLETYNTYVHLQGGYIIFSFLIILIICARCIDSFRTIYITSWSKSIKGIKLNNNNNIDSEKELNESLDVFANYLKISFLGIFLNFFIEFIVTRTTIYSLRTLHESMIYKLLRAPINLFHDIVPIGQILSRLTKDIELVQLIIRTVTGFLKSNFMLIACVYICYMYNRYTLIISPLLIIIGILLTNYYISGARNLERLHRVTFSPIINTLSESIIGVEVIRNCNNENNLKKKLYNSLDDHYGVHIYTEGCKGWYHQMLRNCSHLFYGIILSFILRYPNLFSAQAIGLILQYGQDFTIELSNILENFSQIELSMISLERCEAITKINTEKYIVEDSKRKKNKKINEKGEEMKDIWPSKGEIIFNNFSAQYRPTTPIILKNINFKISAGEKVGIVGRTGSGKSSIILAICRIIEGLEGNILIDNVDITTVNLDTLRQNITVVSQDPFILEGSVKENIDPTNKISDDEIEYIMNEFCIVTEIKDKKKRLNFQIKENGANISIGQKQLICFARAMLKKTKILILDEATSSLDVQTEKIINRNMDKHFKDCTIIMIAHHIQVVKKCKRIFVIDNGEIVEDDTYDNLLKNEKSKFYELYKESLVD